MAAPLCMSAYWLQSNQWTGKQSFGGACLHTTSADRMNPYELAISIIGNTLLPFDEDKMIPCYGFGDGELAALTLSAATDNCV